MNVLENVFVGVWKYKNLPVQCNEMKPTRPVKTCMQVKVHASSWVQNAK